MKQKIKKTSKNSSIWNFLLHLNEDLIPNNLQSESGMQRLWEDEMLDIKMRNLKVEESGLLTLCKAVEFNNAYKEATENLYSINAKKVFTESEAISLTLLML